MENLLKKRFIFLVIVLIILGIFAIYFKFIYSPSYIDTSRYFLSRVIKEKNNYKPEVVAEFFKGSNSLCYGWSAIYYPSCPPYEVALVMVDLKEGVEITKGFIKELKNDSDWQEVNKKYNFTKKRFGK